MLAAFAWSAIFCIEVMNSLILLDPE